MRLNDSLRAMAVLALTYAVLGGIGLAMAIPPGYASPIFPAAGVALAVTLTSRGRLLPGVWLGSFLLNVSLATFQGHLSAGALVTAASIALGAFLQAALGAWLILRIRSLRWESLLTERDSLIFLALGGPAACLVSASVGTATLVATGVIGTPQAGFTWWSWYVGDTIGVLVFAPLTLIWLRRHDPLWHDRLRAVVTPMLLVLVAITGAFYAAAHWEARSQQRTFEEQGERLARLLENRFIAHREILASLAHLIEIRPDLPFSDFAYLTRSTLAANPDLSALSFNPLISGAERTTFEARMASTLALKDFHITERDAQGALITARPRPSYVPVAYIAPLEANDEALGFDILSEPMRAAAVHQAITTGKIALTAPIHLVQAGGDAADVLALSPAYARGGKMASRTPIGFAVAVIAVRHLVEIATRQSHLEGIEFELLDLSAPADKQRLFRSTTNALPPGSWRTQVDIDGTPWAVSIYPNAAYLEANRPWMAWLIGVGGMLLAALLQTLMFGMTGRTATVRDVVERQTTEIRRKNAALAQSEELMRNAIEAIGEAFVIFDPDDRLVFFNDHYRALYSASAPAIRLGAKFEEILRFGTANGQYLGAIGREEAWIAERLACHRSGETDLVQALQDGRWLRIRERKTGSGHIVGFRVDVTELYEAKEAAERANQAKSQFLATMSHELRTPMNGVLGMAQLLLLPDLSDAERHEYAQTILDSGHTLMSVLNDILDLSKIEAGRLELRPGLFDPDSLLTEVAALFSGSAQQKGLKLGTHWLGPRGARYFGDANRIRQMLANLVSNAIKFTERGRVHVDAELIHTPAGTPLLRFSVTDTGAGVAEDQQALLFQPFSQLDGSSTRRFGGTGLGLSIVRRLAVMMGGEAGVDSVESQGSTFWFTLQVEASEPFPTDTADAPQHAGAGTADAPHGRVLVVEDNAVNRRVVATMLKRQGYSICLKENGEEAVTAITSNEIDPDAILMDCQMPVMDGFEAARQIRAWEATQGRAAIPIIALTASAYAEDRDRCLEAGMDDYLSKPIDIDSLQAALARHLQPAQPTASPANPVSATPDHADVRLIDRSALEQRFDADPELIICALESYLEEWESVLDALGQSLQAENAKSTHRHAHSIKGMAAAISGAALAELAKTLEVAASRGDLPLVAAHFDTLYNSARALADAARALRDEIAPPQDG